MSFTFRLRPLVAALERRQAPTQVANHLAPSLGKGERLFPGCGKLRTPAEIQVEKGARYGRESRQRGDHRGDDGGHPAKARDLFFGLGLKQAGQEPGRPGAGSPDMGTLAAERFSPRLLRRHGHGPAITSLAPLLSSQTFPGNVAVSAAVPLATLATAPAHRPSGTRTRRTEVASPPAAARCPRPPWLPPSATRLSECGWAREWP